MQDIVPLYIQVSESSQNMLLTGIFFKPRALQIKSVQDLTVSSTHITELHVNMTLFSTSQPLVVTHLAFQVHTKARLNA